jgi:transcriptional regulator with XRE-family HTH domain
VAVAPQNGAFFKTMSRAIHDGNIILTLLPEYSIIHYMSSAIFILERTHGYDLESMPRRSRLQLPPVLEGKESIGRRLARIRKEQGYTQVELAERIGIIQALVSDYERDKLRLNAEMLVRFSRALNVSADEILGINIATRKSPTNPSLKILRRLNKIASLPPTKQKAFLQTIDALLKVQEG